MSSVTAQNTRLGIWLMIAAVYVVTHSRINMPSIIG